jgi:mitosis inhibitor protein kinase SWE1
MDTKLLLSQDDGSDRPISFRSDFEELGHLGSGTFADVYKVRQRRGAPANVFYAVKKSKVQFRSKRERDMLLVEVRAMKLLGQQRECAYVVPFIRAWQEDSYLYVQMGFAERGTLRELMIHLATPGRRGSGGAALSGQDLGAGIAGGARSEGLVPNNTVWHVVHDVCAGLQHIHACGYVHLDIKPANLLITEGGTLQIGDFGMAAAIGRKGDDNEGDTR